MNIGYFGFIYRIMRRIFVLSSPFIVILFISLRRGNWKRERKRERMAIGRFDCTLHVSWPIFITHFMLLLFFLFLIFTFVRLSCWQYCVLLHVLFRFFWLIINHFVVFLQLFNSPHTLYIAKCTMNESVYNQLVLFSLSSSYQYMFVNQFCLIGHSCNLQLQTTHDNCKNFIILCSCVQNPQCLNVQYGWFGWIQY